MVDRSAIHSSLTRLDAWVTQSDWKAYDTFDGLSSPYAVLLHRNNPFLKQVWQQAVRRFPINLRPLLRIRPGMSTKAMGFFAQGFLRLYQTYGDQEHLEKMKSCLQWLIDNRSPGFQGYCWGNHFDYQSRGGNIPKGTPTIVWTGLIGQAFLDAYEFNHDEQDLTVAKSACEFIVKELGWMEMEDGILLRYYPDSKNVIHNASMLGASLLARVNSISADLRYLEVAEKAVRFTVRHRTAEGAWYYGVGDQWAWIDSFHTAYVLESLFIFCRSTGLTKYESALRKGYRYFVETFFLSDGTPRYYAQKTLPIDIQCASQAIQTLVNLRELHPDSIPTATKVADWTIANMQDKTGYFYYRKYPLMINKTPTLHWGQATMFAALAALDEHLHSVQRPAGLEACSLV